jgi:ABC-type cobalt transport system substrate-binding protein
VFDNDEGMEGNDRKKCLGYNLGFGYLGNKIDVLSDKICSKLDKIHDILNNPRLTASRELYRNALKDFQNRYYEEALENCTEAIEKNKTDYISWFLLGKIYFCGKSKFSNVLDIKKAEEAFLNAAKYVDAVIGKTEEANIFASEIYYYLGHTRLIISNDYLIENKIEESNKKLLEAEEASRTSYQLSHENLLARYEQAKHLHFLGNDGEALQLLKEVIIKEKNFAIKAVNDKNFESLWNKIGAIIESLRKELACEILHKSNQQLKELKKELEDIEYALDHILIPSENVINQFDDFYNANLKIYVKPLTEEHVYQRKCACSKFDWLAKKIALEENPNSASDFYPDSVYEPVDKFYCNVMKQQLGNERILKIKKDLENSFLSIDREIKNLECIQNKDYFFLLEKYDSLEETISLYSKKFLVSYLSFTLKELQSTIKCMRYYLATQQAWNNINKQEEVPIKEPITEEEKKRQNRFDNLLFSILHIIGGTILGFVIGFIISKFNLELTKSDNWFLYLVGGILVISLWFYGGCWSLDHPLIFGIIGALIFTVGMYFSSDFIWDNNTKIGFSIIGASGGLLGLYVFRFCSYWE